MKQINSLYIILTSFVVAIIIILMIYDSNLSILEGKLLAASTPNSPQENSDQIAVQMMESVQNLISAVEEDPDNYSLNVQAGNANFDIGRFDQAVRFYKKALQLHAHDVNVEIDLGVCYFNLSKLDSALYYMLSAINKEPDHKQGLYNVGVVYFNMNNKDEAAKYWNHLVHLYPESNEGKSAIKFLEEIQKQKSGI